MKNLKSLLFGTALMAFSAVTVLSSCEPDPCKDVVCQNGGNCDLDGNCVCPSGFQGTNCEVKSNSVFTGTNLTGDDGCVANPAGQSYDHTATFIADPTVANSLAITGFAGYTCVVSGTTQPLVVPVVIDKNNVTVNFTGCTYTITGTGKVETVAGATKMTIDYVAKYGTTTETCKVVYTK
jgi:hypothetical protein